MFFQAAKLLQSAQKSEICWKIFNRILIPELIWNRSQMTKIVKNYTKIQVFKETFGAYSFF